MPPNFLKTMVRSNKILLYQLPPNITGSELVANLALSGLKDLVGASFLIEPDPFKAADLLDEKIKNKRIGLGLKT